MRVLLIFLLFTACAMEERFMKDGKEWKTIPIGQYLMDFPSEFHKKNEKGIDSYIGKIIGEKMEFFFDYGYYSPTCVLTPEEYVNENLWKFDLEIQLINKNHNTTALEFLEVIPLNEHFKNINERKFKVKLKTQDSLWIQEIPIPKEIQNTHFEIDTIFGKVRKICFPNHSEEGKVEMNIRNLILNENINSYLSLFISCRVHSKEERDVALAIFKSIRLDAK